MDGSSTSFSALHGSGVVVPLSKTDAHPLEMLGSSNKNLNLNTESARGGGLPYLPAVHRLVMEAAAAQIHRSADVSTVAGPTATVTAMC